MRPDYCPIGGEPCQSMCVDPCSAVPLKSMTRIIGFSEHQRMRTRCSFTDYCKRLRNRVAARAIQISRENCAEFETGCVCSRPAHAWTNFLPKAAS